MTTSRCWPSGSLGASPAPSRFRTRGGATHEGGLARERRVFLHRRQGRADRRDLRGLRSVGLRSYKAREPRSPPRRELHRSQQHDLAARRRQGPEPTLRSRRTRPRPRRPGQERLRSRGVEAAPPLAHHARRVPRPRLPPELAVSRLRCGHISGAARGVARLPARRREARRHDRARVVRDHDRSASPRAC